MRIHGVRGDERVITVANGYAIWNRVQRELSAVARREGLSAGETEPGQMFARMCERRQANARIHMIRR